MYACTYVYTHMCIEYVHVYVTKHCCLQVKLRTRTNPLQFSTPIFEVPSQQATMHWILTPFAQNKATVRRFRLLQFGLLLEEHDTRCGKSIRVRCREGAFDHAGDTMTRRLRHEASMRRVCCEALPSLSVA